MADRIKSYEINYNILSNATQAAEGFASLLGYVEKLSGKDPSSGMARGLTKLNGEINQVVNSVNRLKTSFTEIRPEIDMSGFRSQIGQMQRAVSEFAQQTRNIMRMAMSGTDKQFAKARSAMAGDIFDAASLRHFEEQLKLLPQRITAAQKAVEDAKAKYNQAVNTPITYPKGSTSEDQKNIAAAAKKERTGLQKIWQDREKELKALQNQQENYQRQAYNLRSSLSQEAMRPIAAPKEEPRIPAGVQKAVGLIPRWQKEYEQARAAALVKRAELAGSMREPQRVAKPSFYGIKSPFGGGGIDSYLREYEQAFKRNAASSSVAQQRIMADAKTNFMALSGYNETQFAEALRQYQAYEQYRTAYGNWVRAGRPQGQAYNETEEYKNYRSSLKRLRAAYGVQRQAEALKARIAAQAAPPPSTGGAVGGGGPLPPILGMPTQVIEQAFTGKLTLLPDIPAAKALIAAESFSANLNLVPMISELRAKLNSETFKVNVTPIIAKTRGKAAATGGAIGTLQEEINALQQSAKAPITVGTKLDRGGLLSRAQGGYNTLQALANRHPITYKLTSDGSGGFSLNQALARLTQLAKSHPVPFRMVHDGSGAFSLNQALARLQTLAATRPIAISLNANIGNLQTAITKALTSGNGGPKSFMIDIKPRVGALSQSIKAALTGTGGAPRSFFIDVKARTAQLTSSINQVLRGKVFNISAKLDASTLTSGVPLLERLQRVWAQLPKTGKRTYTVNLKTTGLSDIAKIERVIALVNSLPPGTTKNYRFNTTANGGNNVVGGVGSRRNPVYTKNAEDFYTRARRATYPFTGNTSFGARTPAAFDMMKGMGMMMGIGGAMGVIGGSFSDAVSYQNTMETAKAILRDNYKGDNFNQDYNDMVKVIRDVAMRTKFTAPEAADAARFMAMAGLDIPMIKSAIAPIADVAAISDTDLGLVADKMTNIMTEFKVAPSQMRNLADMMTKTFTSTNTDMMMLAESLQYAGPMAFASGQSLAETLAMIGIMGNSGIQASMAGTTMRMMLQNLYNPNKNQAKFMQQIGLRTRDANGNRRSLFEILSDISRLTGSNDTRNVVGNLLSGKDAKNNLDTFDAASKLFRVTAAAGGASLLGNIGGLADLIAKIQSANGNSEAVSIAKQNTVAGMWAQAKSAFTEAVVKVFEDTDMQKYIKDTLGGLINYLKQPEFIQTMKDLFELIKGIGSVLAKFVGWWVKLYQTFPNLVKWVMIGQMFFTQVGYLITPFVQLIGLITSFGNAIKGVIGISGAAAGLSAVTRGAAATTILGNAMNLSPASTVGSALVGGSVMGGRFAQTYAQRAAMYRTAAAKQYDMIGAFVAGRSLQNMSNSDRIALQQMLNRRTRLTEMGTSYGLLAMQSTMINRQRKAGQLSDKELLTRAARQNRLSFANYRRGIGMAFQAGMFGYNPFAGLWTSIKAGLTSVTLGLSKALGVMAGPIGWATAAVAGFGYMIYNQIDQARQWEESILGLATAARQRTEEFYNRYNTISNVWDNIQSVTINTPNVNINENKEENKALKDSLDPKKLLGATKHEDVYRSLINEQLLKAMPDLPKTFQAEGTTTSTLPWYLAGSTTESDYLNTGQISSNLSAVQRQILIARAYVGSKALEDARLAAIQDEIIGLAQTWLNTPKDKRSSYEELRAQFTQALNRFNPANFPGAQRIGESNYNSAIYNPASNYDYYSAGYQHLLNWYNENAVIKSIAAVNAINNGVQANTAQWLGYMGDLMGSIEFTQKTGNDKIERFTLPTNNGVVQWQTMLTNLRKLGINFGNTLTERLGFLAQAYNMLNANAFGAEQLSQANLGLLFSYMLGQQNGVDRYGADNIQMARDYYQSLGYGDQKINSLIQGGLWANGTNWKNIVGWGASKYINGQVTTDPTLTDYTVPHPGMDWNYILQKWVPKIPATTPASTPTTPINTNHAGNNTNPTTPQPTAYTPSSLNSGYESSYSKNAARPTQVVINIDKLMNTDKMMIASDAEERQLAGMMEDKVEQALDILKTQIVMSLQRGDYNLS